MTFEEVYSETGNLLYLQKCSYILKMLTFHFITNETTVYFDCILMESGKKMTQIKIRKVMTSRLLNVFLLFITIQIFLLSLARTSPILWLLFKSDLCPKTLQMHYTLLFTSRNLAVLATLEGEKTTPSLAALLQ